jgi:DNA-binding GntR family transcriptional regulator
MSIAFPAPPVGQPVNARAIHAVLRQDIVSLRLPPGARLSENELAERFGTSRAPVREALIRLVEDGLIEVRPQRGSFVTRISLAAMESSRFVREALEVAIIRQAAGKGIAQAAQAHIEATILAQIDTHGAPERFTQLDDLFHRAFAEAAGLAAVWAIVEREKAQFDRVRFLSLPSTTPVEVLVQQHRAILAAVLARDPAAAEQAMRAHLTEVLKITRRVAEQYPDYIMADL